MPDTTAEAALERKSAAAHRVGWGFIALYTLAFMSNCLVFLAPLLVTLALKVNSLVGIERHRAAWRSSPESALCWQSWGIRSSAGSSPPARPRRSASAGRTCWAAPSARSGSSCARCARPTAACWRPLSSPSALPPWPAGPPQPTTSQPRPQPPSWPGSAPPWASSGSSPWPARSVVGCGTGERYSPEVAALLLGTWAIVTLAVGAITLHRRDP